MTKPDQIDQPETSSTRQWRFLSIRLPSGFLNRGLLHLAKISLFNRRRARRLARPASKFPGGSVPAHLSPRQLGQLGEQLAASHLVSLGYQLVASNFRGPIGRRPDGRAIEGEIDLIAYDLTFSPPVLVFLEVKTRRDDQLARPEAAVDHRKRLRLIRTARLYRRFLSLQDQPYRFDVISLLLPANDSPQLIHLKSYFSDHF